MTTIRNKTITTAALIKIKTAQCRITDSNESIELNHACDVNCTISGLDGTQGFLEKCCTDTKPVKEIKNRDAMIGAKIFAIFSPSIIEVMAIRKNVPKKSKKTLVLKKIRKN